MKKPKRVRCGAANVRHAAGRWGARARVGRGVAACGVRHVAEQVMARRNTCGAARCEADYGAAAVWSRGGTAQAWWWQAINLAQMALQRFYKVSGSSG